MPVLTQIILANLIISLGGLIGFFTVKVSEKYLSKILLFFVSLSAGALMGAAFIHLLPEIAENSSGTSYFYNVLIAFVLFFVLEKVLHWHHCHKHGHCDVHTFGTMNLIGDSLHNFIDGLIIAATFIVDTKLGIATTVAVAMHEIPQEIGDFGVLIYSGYTKTKALIVNFVVAFTAVLGGVVGYFAQTRVENFVNFLLPFAVGGFIYIASSDLMPEIRKENDLKRSAVSFAVFLLGILIMVFTKTLH